MENIKELLTEIENYLSQYSASEQISEIEKDIVLEKIRTLYDTIKSNKIEVKECVITPEIQEIETTIETEQIKEEIIEEPIENLSEDSEFGIEDMIPQEQQFQEITSSINVTEPEKETQTYTPKQSTDLGSKLGKQPISDILNALSLNDRYLYRSQLFNNDADLFRNSINTLNDCKNFDAAIQYIKNNFSWDFEAPIVVAFLQVVERRFL